MRITLCIKLISAGIICLSLFACANKTAYRNSCAIETNAAWDELSIAKTKGFAGTISYTKALSLLTAARTMQIAENFDACYKNAKTARNYIKDSYQGQ